MLRADDLTGGGGGKAVVGADISGPSRGAGNAGIVRKERHAVVGGAFGAAIVTGIKHQPVEAVVTAQIHLVIKPEGRSSSSGREGGGGGVPIRQSGSRSSGAHRGTGGDGFIQGHVWTRQGLDLGYLRVIAGVVQVFETDPTPVELSGGVGSSQHFINPAGA